jgi:AcrR family transcriptional regulator
VVGASKAKSARRTQHERSAESAKQLVAATIELIAEKGFERTTAAEIGERAGYSREMVRHRYGSKEQLLEWLLEHEQKTLLLRPPSGVGSGLDQALEQIQLTRQVAVDDPERLRAFLVLCFEAVGPIPTLGPWMRDWFDAYVRQLADVLRTGQADGSIRADLDPDSEAKDITYYSSGLCFSYVLHGDIEDFASSTDRLHARILEMWASRHPGAGSATA